MTLSGRVVFPLVLLGATAYAFVALQHVLLPFVLAAAVAYILNPVIVFFQTRGIRRERAVMVVYTLILCLFITFTYLAATAIIQSTTTAAVEMPGYIAQAGEFLKRMERIPWLQQMALGESIRHQVLQDSRSWAFRLLGTTPTLIRVHLLPLLEMAFLVPFLTYFFMQDGPRFLERLLDLVPARYVEMFLNVFTEMNHSFGNYLRGLVIQGFFMGFLAGVSYGLIGLHYAVYIAIWVAITSAIPFLGPISAALTGALVALFQWGTVAGLVKVLGVYIAIRFADDWILQPQILRRAVHIHPVVTVFSLLAGAYVAGIWGLLFAVPVACMLKVLFEVGWQWYRVEYGLRPPAAAPDILQIPIV